MTNIVILCGRLTADPELKSTPNGVSVTSFSLAVERDYKNGDDRQTDFIDVVAWRGTAEFIAKYFKKGKMMIASGALQKRNYEANDGTKRYVTEVVADKVWFAGDKGANNEAANTPSAPQAQPANTQAADVEHEEILGDDDLPF